MTEPAFSRPTESCVLGKRTAEIPKLKVPEETREILSERARKAGMNLTEYMTWRAMIDAHGIETVQKLQADRLRVVAGTGREPGRNRG